MTNNERAVKWLADNLVKDSGQRRETLAALLDAAEQQGRLTSTSLQSNHDRLMLQPAGILRNVLTGRFHPIVFRYAPLPSSPMRPAVERYKSQGHHTEGFYTEEEAVTFVKAHLEWTLTSCRWKWNGEDVPAMVEFFGLTDRQEN